MVANILYLAIAGIVRGLLAFSKYSEIFGNRKEISTPLNSFKRVREGIYLYNNGINPYSGDMVHESPLILLALKSLIDIDPHIIPVLFVVLDIITGVLLATMTRNFLKDMLKEERSKTFAAGTDYLQLQNEDISTLPKYVLLAYLFNPFSILSCSALSLSVISNFLLSLYFYFLSKKQMVACLFFLAIESMRNFYPIVLVAPALLSSRCYQKAFVGGCYFLAVCAGICWMSFRALGNWTFLNETLGFIFFYRDLQPNIGLFWYFFTEMFEHFRTLFLITFQMNATILYMFPLSIKLRNNPFILATILLSLVGIFRAYPCIGDIALYLSLLPAWKRCWKFMAHNFVVFCFFLITISIMPTLWHLWIYAGSANANFYFGVTLGFSTGQIFLVTDLLFAYIKRDFCLKNGEKTIINGKEAKIVLE